MDLSILYQLKNKKVWWLDTVFYFFVALLLATVFCFFIFSFKISLQEKTMKDLDEKIANVGTAQQKELENQVATYQKKIDNFATILTNHKIPTNVLGLLEKITLPNVWFYTFAMSSQTSSIQLAGEAESTTALTRQISIFDGNIFIKEITGMSSETAETGRIKFSLTLSINPDIFFQVAPEVPVPPGGILDTTSPSTSAVFNSYIF